MHISAAAGDQSCCCKGGFLAGELALLAPCRCSFGVLFCCCWLRWVLPVRPLGGAVMAVLQKSVASSIPAMPAAHLLWWQLSGKQEGYLICLHHAGLSAGVVLAGPQILCSCQMYLTSLLIASFEKYNSGCNQAQMVLEDEGFFESAHPSCLAL